MEYANMKKGIFLERPNRFIAHVELNGTIEVCHVKNTGRCRELLLPGATVYVQESDNPARKTRYSLIAVEKGNRLINMDSQAPNEAVAEWLPRSGLFSSITKIRREYTYQKSRFDFYIEADGKPIFLEVKGVTLEDKNIACFPDAPTERGARHLEELIDCTKHGYGAYAVFVIQMKGIQFFTPNWVTDPVFSRTLYEAQKQGVRLLAVDCQVSPTHMEIQDFIPIHLEES